MEISQPRENPSGYKEMGEGFHRFCSVGKVSQEEHSDLGVMFKPTVFKSGVVHNLTVV